MTGREPHVSKLNQHNYNQGWWGKGRNGYGWIAKRLAKHRGSQCGGEEMWDHTVKLIM